MIIETELKLTINKADIDHFCRHPLLAQYAIRPAKIAQIRSFYFDTADYFLLRNGYVARIREADNVLKQTIKNTNKSRLGLHQRSEWEQIVPTMQLYLDNFPDPHVGEKLLARKQQIISIFMTDIKNTTWILEVDKTRIEVALDQGQVRSGQQTEDVCEVELELLSGQTEELFKLAKQFAKDIHLVPEDKTKAERGYRLYAKQQKRSLESKKFRKIK
jgi:inorganic triphosphatase YgiF